MTWNIDGKEVGKRQALENHTTDDLVVSSSYSSNTSSIFDLEEDVKLRYQDTDIYRSLENSEIEYATKMARSECTRCSQDMPGKIICCEEDCAMFKAKKLAYEREFTVWSPCYNCPLYNVECLGYEYREEGCPVEVKDRKIALDALEGIFDDDQLALLAEVGINEVDEPLLDTLRNTKKYFSERKRYSLMQCKYLLSDVAEHILSHYTLLQVLVTYLWYQKPLSQQKKVVEISKVAIGYKIRYRNSVIYITEDYGLIKGGTTIREVKRVLKENNIPVPDLMEKRA